VCDQHEEIQSQLTEMQEMNSKIFSLVADVRYKDGFDTIDAIYTTFMTGRICRQKGMLNQSIKNVVSWSILCTTGTFYNLQVMILKIDNF